MLQKALVPSFSYSFLHNVIRFFLSKEASYRKSYSLITNHTIQIHCQQSGISEVLYKSIMIKKSIFSARFLIIFKHAWRLLLTRHHHLPTIIRDCEIPSNSLYGFHVVKTEKKILEDGKAVTSLTRHGQQSGSPLFGVPPSSKSSQSLNLCVSIFNRHIEFLVLSFQDLYLAF